MLLLQVTDEASGEFSIAGTLVALIIIAGCAYAAYWSWAKAGDATGIKMWVYRATAGFTGTIAVLGVISFFMNLFAAIGLL